MKNILIVTTFSDTFSFFNRLAKPLKESGFNPFFYTNKYSNYLSAKNYGHNVIAIKHRKKVKEYPLPETFLEVNVGELSLNKAQYLNSTIQTQLEELNEKLDFQFVLIWGGVRLIQRAVRDFARRNNIQTIYFELGNFPGKVFCDPLGTNADSLLAKDKSVLGKFTLDLNSFNQWRNNYIESSLKAHKVPQSSNITSIDYKKNILDLIGFKFYGFIPNSPVLTFNKLSNKFLGKKINFNFDNISADNEKYIFYPMQVSDDAQIVINSNVDNIDALKHASKLAKEKGLKLFVKPHPAERNFNYVKEVVNLKTKLGFYFVNGNTIEFINKSQEVITINSTVGLQAKILGKNVTCLGKAFYNEFTKEELGKYITNYLLDIDFWGQTEISTATLQKIIRQAKLNG